MRVCVLCVCVCACVSDSAGLFSLKPALSFCLLQSVGPAVPLEPWERNRQQQQQSLPAQCAHHQRCRRCVQVHFFNREVPQAVRERARERGRRLQREKSHVAHVDVHVSAACCGNSLICYPCVRVSFNGDPHQQEGPCPPHELVGPVGVAVVRWRTRVVFAPAFLLSRYTD